MNETQTRVLIQRELDGNLSKDEEARLRRVLMVSDSASSFRSNLSQVAAVAQGLDLPEHVRPANSSQLATEILENLTTTKRSFWEPLFTLFSNKEKSEVASQKPPIRRSTTQQNFSATNQSGSHKAIADEAQSRIAGPHPQLDQYVTGTHAAIGGGLAKKLNKNQADAPAEEKGTTLAEAIRARIHDARQAETRAENRFEVPFVAPSPPVNAFHNVPEPQIHEEQNPAPQADFRVNPAATEAPPEVSKLQINIAPSISLTIMGQGIVSATNVSTPSVVVDQNAQAETPRPANEFPSKQIPFDEIPTQWTSGNYPEYKRDLNTPPSTSQSQQPQVSLHATQAPQHPQPPQPVISPVVRASQQPPRPASTLPIDAISERINLLFQDPKNVQPPTFLPAPTEPVAPPAMPTTGKMDERVDACLSSVGRLSDIRYATNNPGTITNVGNFLLSEQNRKTVEHLISNAKNQSGARVFTYEAAQELTELLAPIARFESVLGYVICGYDGLLIANSLPADFDAETIAGCALVSYMNSHAIMKVLGYTRITQSISLTQSGYMILADFGRGLLTVLVDGSAVNLLAALSFEIEQITAE